MVHPESSGVTAEAPLVTLQAPERSELNRPPSLYLGGLIPRLLSHPQRATFSPTDVSQGEDQSNDKGGRPQGKGRYLESDRWVNVHHRSTKHA